MAFQVEQVNSDGEIVEDYDTSLSASAIYDKLSQCFPNIKKNSDGIIWGEYKGDKYSIRIKNVTYLGNPHPNFKKRIQIPNDLHDFYKKSKKMGLKPLLMGIYTYKDNTLFCEFNIEDFIDKKAHNSSAHIYTSDLSMATRNDFFEKEDYFGNHITVFSPRCVDLFLSEVFYGDDITCVFNEDTENNFKMAYCNKYPIERQNRNTFKEFQFFDRISHYVKTVFPDDIIQHIGTFFYNEPKNWNGISCYKKMIEHNYKNKYQPEWPGFFLEFEFENYIHQNSLQDDVKYAQDKKNGGIDLDLFFPKINSYGDLKAHSNSSRGIQGNDLKTVMNIFQSDTYKNHIYYIVCEHGTKKDSECNYVVTEFWNKAQGKDNLRSYAKRMKNSVSLEKMYILDINAENRKYLSIFKQGVNSNGKPRAPKIMIEHDNMKYFKIFEMIL